MVIAQKYSCNLQFPAHMPPNGTRIEQILPIRILYSNRTCNV